MKYTSECMQIFVTKVIQCPENLTCKDIPRVDFGGGMQCDVRLICGWMRLALSDSESPKKKGTEKETISLIFFSVYHCLFFFLFFTLIFNTSNNICNYVLLFFFLNFFLTQKCMDNFFLGWYFDLDHFISINLFEQLFFLR